MSSEPTSGTSSESDGSRKRKFENVDDDDNSKLKIAKPSLGLSLLQSYDEEDDYMTSDEEPTSPPSKLCVDSSVPSRNVFIEEMTDEDQVDESPIDQSANLEAGGGTSLSVLEANNSSSDKLESSILVDSNIDENASPLIVNVEKSDDEPNVRVLNIALSESSTNEVHDTPVESSSDANESIGTETSSFCSEFVVEPADAKTDSINESKETETEQTDDTFSSETSDSNNVDSNQTGVTVENEPKSDIRPDYNFSVFGTSGETGSSDERMSSKPAKKVKLNRSKFIRSVDESSNEAKSNAISSSPVLPSLSESDSKPMVQENFKHIKPNVGVIATEIIKNDQRTEEVSVNPVEVNRNISDEIAESSDFDKVIIPATEENISVDTFDVGLTDKSVTDTNEDISGKAVETPDPNQLISEPIITKDTNLSSDATEEDSSLSVHYVSEENLENIPQSTEEIVPTESSSSKIDSQFDTESGLFDEEIVGPTDVPDILQISDSSEENVENADDHVIEVMDQDLDVDAKNEEHLDSSVNDIEELNNENLDINFTEEVGLSEADVAEKLEDDTAHLNVAEDFIEELMDENSIIQESTNEILENENSFVEERTDENAITENAHHENLFFEESKEENLIHEESKDESSVIEESNKNLIIEAVEELESENPSVDTVEDSKKEDDYASPLSFDADQSYSLDLEESLDEDNENESVENAVENKNTNEPPHRPLKIIIRKKEEKLVVVDDASRIKKRGRKSAKKLQKEKSKMKGDEYKKKIVETDEGANFELNKVVSEEVGEEFAESSQTVAPVDIPGKAEAFEIVMKSVPVEQQIRETDELERKEEAVAPAVSEIIDSTASSSAPVANESSEAVESDDEIFKDAMDTIEPELAERNSEKQSDFSLQSSSHEQYSLPTSETVDEPVVSTVSTDAEFVTHTKIGDEELVQNIELEQAKVSGSDKMTNEPIEVDVENFSANTPSDTPSKLEQALTRKLKSVKNVESTTSITTSLQEVPESDKSAPEALSKEPPPVKENLKLHLSVQGNRVSIKKNIAAESVIAPTPDIASVPAPLADAEVPPPRVKRQYRKRPKPTIDPALLTEEKCYTLRTRNTKNPPEEVTPKKTKGRKSAATIAAEAAALTVAPFEPTSQPITLAKKEKLPREPSLSVTVEIDSSPEKKVTTAAGKVKPIRLKIKNPGITVECTSKYSPVTIEKIGGPAKGAVSENIADILEEARKKESQTAISHEQLTWSGTDLQRVERLLKESNITITPVSSATPSSSAESISQSSCSILKTNCAAAKDKSARKSFHKAPLAPPPSSSTIGAASITPVFSDSENAAAEASFARNLNVTLKPLDFEEQLSHWKIAKPSREMDVTRIPPPVTEQQKQHPVDVKLEIRKKIASSERRRQIREPEVVITVDESMAEPERIYSTRNIVEVAPELNSTMKEVRRKSRPRPTAVTDETQTSAEEITSRLKSKPDISDEFILPDSTPPVVDITDTPMYKAKDPIQKYQSEAKVTSEPKSQAQIVLEKKLETPVTLVQNVEIRATLESKAAAPFMLEPNDQAQAMSLSKAKAEVTVPPEEDISEVMVIPEIEVLKHVIQRKTEHTTTESTSKVENVEPAVESVCEAPTHHSKDQPAERLTKVEPEELSSSDSSSVAEVSPEIKPEITAPPQTLEIKQITSESKFKTSKQMPDLLPISKPQLALKSVQIIPITSQVAQISPPATPLQSQIVSSSPQVTPVNSQLTSTVPQSPMTQPKPTVPHFLPMTPQIKLNVTPLTPKMLQEALAAPQFTPAQQISSASSFMGSSMGTPMSAVSMNQSCSSSMMVDSSVNTPSRPFTDSATPSYSNLPPLMFPKKRGRPTKAMVAAREAYRQSQEAMEGFKRQNFEQTPSSMDAVSTPQPMPPPSDESSMSNLSVELVKLPIKRGRKIKLEKLDLTDGSDDATLAEKLPMDPEREMEELKRLEEDRIRKEQERERKNELRRQKAKERSDMEKAKKLRQRQKAEERHKKVQEQRRLLQEQKKKLEEEIKKLPGFEDGRVTTADVAQMSNGSFLLDEDSNSMSFDSMQRLKKTKMEVYDPDGNNLTVDQIAEYQWPIQGGELYMIQEQISNFLGVKSFKRKYPDIKRRPVDSEERAYLVDSGLVSETLCDLGITAVCSAEVLDIMCSDFSEKYEELRKHMREKQMKELSFKQKAWANGLGYKLLMADGSKQDLKKRAMESVSNWNSALNKGRHEDRRSAIDLQTFIIHYPKSKIQNMTTPSPKIGSYPISIIPGQFCDFYKEYTSNELRYLPVNTVIYGPVRHPSAAKDVDGSQTDSDDSSSSDESSSTTSEGTQATEDTLEDVDKDMSLDESLLAEKLPDGNTSLREDTSHREMANGVTEASSQDDGKILCKVCLGDETRNKENASEVLICCSQCCSSSHPTCLDLSLNMVPHMKSYKWQCPDCKNCAKCKEYADEDKMLFCDICDRGYHIYCVGLKKVPSGSWQCEECTAVEDQVNRENLTLAPNLPASIPIKIES